MVETKTDIFTGIGYTIDSLLANIQTMSLNDKMQQLQLCLSAIITLTIMYKGYLILAGKSQDPIRELVWDLGRKAFILSFAMGSGMWLQYSVEAIRGIYEWAGGGANFYQQLNSLVDSVINYSGTLLRDISVFSPAYSFLIVLIVIIIGVCFVAICFELFFSIIACGISNAFLIIALPLALFCLMWNQTKQVFTQWCQLLLSNTFTLLFLSMFLGFCQSAISTIFNPRELNKELINVLLHAFEVVLISFTLIQIIRVIKSLAQNLAQVSLESAISGTGSPQVLGSIMGSAARSMGKAGLGAAGSLAGKNVMSAIEGGGLAGVAGNLVARGAIGGVRGLNHLRKSMLQRLGD